jgi:small GTP-binding protein
MRRDEEFAQALKLVVIGPQRTGKTSLINTFHYGRLQSHIAPTVGACSVVHAFTIKEETVSFQLWDTAGQEKYRSLSPMFYRDSAGAIAVFDLSVESSLDEAHDFIDHFRENASGWCHIALVGNKSDLVPVVDVSAAQKWAADQKYSFHCASALTGDGVQQMFQEVAEIVFGLSASTDVQRSDITRPSESNCQC